MVPSPARALAYLAKWFFVLVLPIAELFYQGEGFFVFSLVMSLTYFYNLCSEWF